MDDVRRRSLDPAIAFSLGLTSFVSLSTASVSHLPDPLNKLCEPQEPRDALDRFIRELERKAAGKYQSRRDLAAGYRFEAPGPWSDPPDLNYKPYPNPLPPSLEFVTHLTTQSGTDCGSDTIQFALHPPEGQRFGGYYSISKPRITNLTNLITACVSRQ